MWTFLCYNLGPCQYLLLDINAFLCLFFGMAKLGGMRQKWQIVGMPPSPLAECPKQKLFLTYLSQGQLSPSSFGWFFWWRPLPSSSAFERQGQGPRALYFAKLSTTFDSNLLGHSFTRRNHHTATTLIYLEVQPIMQSFLWTLSGPSSLELFMSLCANIRISRLNCIIIAGPTCPELFQERESFQLVGLLLWLLRPPPLHQN